MAGHSATVHRNLMVVFGGIQKEMRESPYSGISTFNCCNSVWVLDMKTLNWRKQATTSFKPMARYGHSQIAIDDHNLLILGGCGGPNMLFSDIWLLKMKEDPNAPWEWEPMVVKQREYGAPHLAFHPACKVGNQVVVMCKTKRSQMSPSALPYPLRTTSRGWIPPMVHPGEFDTRIPARQPIDVEQCVNGKKGVLKRQSERHHQHISSRTSSSDEDDFHSPDIVKKQNGCTSAKRSSPPDPSLNEFGSSCGAGGSKALTRHKAFAHGSGTFSKKQSSELLDFASKLSSHKCTTSSPSTKCTSSSFSTEDLLNQDGPSQLMTEGLQSGSLQLSVLQTSTVSSAQAKILSCDKNCVSLTPCDPCASDLTCKEGNEQEPLRSGPSSRRNSRRNRQRQLEGLDRMEKRLRDLRAGVQRFANAVAGAKPKVAPLCVASKNPMCLYVLDISTACDSGFVTWRKLKNQSACAPEGIILYSLVLGRGELIMFGGVQKDLSFKLQEGETVPEVVSNALHFMSAQRFVI